MIARRQDVPRFQSDLFRNAYYRVLRLLFVSMGIILLLILAIIYLILFMQTPNYYASTTSGEIIALNTVKVKS